MSSIERSGQKSEISQMREFYTKKEAELVQKQDQTLREVKSQHAEEVETIRDKTQAEIEKIKEHTRERMTEQEQRHIKDIDNLRALYQKKMESRS